MRVTRVNTAALRSAAEPVPAAKAFQHDPYAGMNRLEAAYARHLDDLRTLGEIAAWRFAPIKLRLADRTYYTPDFLVLLQSGHIEFHETKGWMRDDANVKLKVAAEQFRWFRFVLVTKRKREWRIHPVRNEMEKA